MQNVVQSISEGNFDEFVARWRVIEMAKEGLESASCWKSRRWRQHIDTENCIYWSRNGRFLSPLHRPSLPVSSKTVDTDESGFVGNAPTLSTDEPPRLYCHLAHGTDNAIPRLGIAETEQVFRSLLKRLSFPRCEHTSVFEHSGPERGQYELCRLPGIHRRVGLCQGLTRQHYLDDLEMSLGQAVLKSDAVC